jgi:hypothetical protein
MAKFPPLDSPHWRPWDVIAQQYVERSGTFAARDMERDLETDALQAMFRRDNPAEGQQEREPLLPEFWRGWEFYDRNILGARRSVGVRARDPAIAERYRGGAFFLWAPDLSQEDRQIEDEHEDLHEDEQTGRPTGSTSIDYTDMDVLIDFQRKSPSAITQTTLIALIQHVYAQKYGKAPARSTIKARINPKDRRPKRK